MLNKLFCIRITCIIILYVADSTLVVNAQNVAIEKLGETVNTDIYQEISPVLSPDGSILYFTRSGSPDFEKYLELNDRNLYETNPETRYMELLADIYRQLGDNEVRNPHRSSFNQDVWIATSADGKKFDKVYHPGPPLNNALPNSISSLTPVNNRFVIINQFPKGGGMLKGFSTIDKKNDTEWYYPKPLYIDNYFNNSDIVSFTMSADGKVAVLSLKRDDSLGENDLYICQHIKDSLWSEPVNLKAVNSAANEISPYLTEDGRTLFFASSRPGGYGGLDIYMATKPDTDWEQWTTPKPLHENINSAKDDFQPHYNSSTGYLYFSTRRAGSSDIYRAKIGDQNPVKINIFGKVIDSKTLRPVRSSVYIGNESEDNYRKMFETSTGEFTTVAGKNDKIKIFLFNENYLSQPYIIDVSALQIGYSNSVEINFYIDPKVVDGRISMNPIYFVQSKPEILQKSKPELEKLAELLRNNSSLCIRIEGHTDNLGKVEDLLKLSQERAESVKSFLIQSGIDGARLTTKGYGASQPVNDNASVELREKNRRVEFIITKI
ncbi:MAG TPA: OmpA family protein [Saprospiraceae bacterium]|nr:OmpA family protein [Saprospiraceae bacterium]HNA40523.1 OmpA family protein [Saprospiraceae bacterium]HNO36504.1 OmpA family protein [Saprospiraceae bacterium]